MRAIIFATALLLPTSTPAQSSYLPTTPQDVPAFCQKRELRPTTLAVMGRDRGIDRNKFTEALPMDQMNPLDLQLATERLRDVYDHPELTALTLVVFRSASCIDEHARKGFPKYKDALGAALLACQNESAGSVRDLAQCVANATDENIVK